MAYMKIAPGFQAFEPVACSNSCQQPRHRQFPPATPPQHRALNPAQDFQSSKTDASQSAVAGQLVRLALGDHRRAPARPIDPPGS
ncbi:MAG: hypothetical protein JO252_12240, partial [Planctomycetaceae bacterium]|nr:hypothetical protein [Planctomycetaceae bacterium]